MSSALPSLSRTPWVIALLVGVGLWLGLGGTGSARGAAIGVVEVEGTITDSEETVEQIRKYIRDDSVRGILLRVNSPGGGVAASQEIYDEVRAARQAGKVVVVSMGSVAASGGYYISCPADRIIANPGTITGSIGVIMVFGNLEGLLKKVGLKTVTVKSGLHKDVGSPFRDMTEEEMAILQSLTDDVHEQFIQAIAVSRNLDETRVRSLADGSVFSGRQARELGLVDDLGGYQYALSELARMAGIEGEPRVLRARRPPGFLEWLLRGKLWRKLPDLEASLTTPKILYLWGY